MVLGIRLSAYCFVDPPHYLREEKIAEEVHDRQVCLHLNALQKAGYARSIEAGRGVIQDQVAIGGQCLPWADAGAFAELMLSWEMRSYHIAKQTTGSVFFDRGVPDVIGYLRLLKRSVPPHMEKAAQVFRYNRRVFIAPPWRQIFRRDRERKQDFAEAVRTHEVMVATYLAYGYELIEIPCSSVEARMDFVLSNANIADQQCSY